MLLVIGGRYLVFATIYGMRLYWVLGLALALAGVVLAWRRASPVFVVAAGAAIEFAFGFVAIVQHRHWVRPNHSSKPPPLRGAASPTVQCPNAQRLRGYSGVFPR